MSEQTGNSLDCVKRSVCTLVIVAAVYIYFLIFAQFAFLRLAQADGLGAEQIRIVMAVMGLMGAGVSIALIGGFGWLKVSRWLVAGFSLCGLAALWSLAGHGLGARCAQSALIGVGLALTTVSLSASTPMFFPRDQRGLMIGLGTGLAYACCNVPAIFAANPAGQAMVAAVVCLAGALAVLPMRIQAKSQDLPAPDFAPAISAFPALIVAFLALVWLDSAAFYILQATPELNRFGWATSRLQWTNAGIHLAAAVLAGLWLDRGGMRGLLLAAYSSLAAAALLLATSTALAGTHWFYAVGVSFYSTALVYAPSALGGHWSLKVAARRAALLYAVAGWVGSALGVGMAQDLHRIPFWFVAISGCLVAGSLFFRRSAV